jgi:hypothetical protein
MTYLGYGAGCMAIIGIYYFFSTREKAFYLLFVYITESYVNEQLKLIYKNPRPFMSSDAMIAYSCSKSFGNPSGHAHTSACFYVSLFLLFFFDKDHTLS